MLQIMKKINLLAILIILPSCQTFKEVNFDFQNFDIRELNFFDKNDDNNIKKEKRLIGDNFLDFFDQIL